MRALNLLLILLIATSLSAVANAKTLDSLDLTVSLDKDGGAVVTEVYKLTLDTEEERAAFDESIGAFGANMVLWTLYDENLKIHFSDSLQALNKTVSAKQEDGTATVEFGYQTENLAYSTMIPDEGELWELNNEKLNFPIHTGLLEIGENTTVMITLPENAELKEVAPQAHISARSIVWNGPTSANRLVIKYEIKRVLVPTTSFQIPLPKTDQTTNAIILGIVVVLAMILTLQRDKIRKRLGKYIISHSSVRPEKYENAQENEN
ncbi:MAG: hypothetical protein GOV15_00205 [Candidatus Diapherotrites archaeon]|nr:hypothetical protein [Candidatus Diapherotrites archaeon]